MTSQLSVLAECQDRKTPTLYNYLQAHLVTAVLETCLKPVFVLLISGKVKTKFSSVYFTLFVINN